MIKYSTGKAASICPSASSSSFHIRNQKFGNLLPQLFLNFFPFCLPFLPNTFHTSALTHFQLTCIRYQPMQLCKHYNLTFSNLQFRTKSFSQQLGLLSSHTFQIQDGILISTNFNKMLKSATQVKLMQKESTSDVLIHPMQAPPYSKSSFEMELVPASTSSSSQNVGRISPIVLLMIVILAAIFFVSGCLHLLFRYLMKRPPSRSLFQSNRYSDQGSTSHVLQRQLQQLFRLHDSGLDQSSIDNLPLFHYKDIIGLKQQFDCAVCLSEFSSQDKLRLLPLCSHAFHINCIDPWLFSNSTCPLCRGTLMNPSLNSITHMMTSSDDLTEISNGQPSETENSITLDDSFSGEKRVYSIRLGKFRTLSDESNSDPDGNDGNCVSSKLDARRCSSMGSYQYVVNNNSFLKVALDMKLAKEKAQAQDCVSADDIEGQKISSSVKGESFSMSKIWLWSKKSEFQDQHRHHHPEDYNLGVDARLEFKGRLDIV